MKIKESNLEDIIYKIHRDVSYLNLRRGLDAYRAIKYNEHNLILKLRHIVIHSVKTETKEKLILKTSNQEVIFKRESSMDFYISLVGKGDMIDSVVETCANYEMRQIKKDIYVIDNNKLLHAQSHSEGYLLKDIETGICNEYLSSKDMYELYAKVPHTVMEEKLIILKGEIR